jgi:cytochrome P450
MQQLLAPIIEQRIREQAAGGKTEHVDLLQWFIDAATEDQKQDPTFLAISQVNASLAAIHSTAIVVTNAIFDLATRPHYVEPLRAELQSLRDATGGTLVDMGLLRLPKLDSFLKESQRLNPLGLSKLTSHLSRHRPIASDDSRGLMLTQSLQSASCA